MQTKHIKLMALFIVSYILLYVLYATQDFFPLKWDIFGASFFSGKSMAGQYAFFDPLFLFAPVLGFAFMYLALEFASKEFASDETIFSVMFGLIYLVIAYAVWLVALIGYYWNNAYLVGVAQGNPNPTTASFGPTLDFALENFVSFLLASPYFTFVLAGLLGWISFVILYKYWGEKRPVSYSA